MNATTALATKTGLFLLSVIFPLGAQAQLVEIDGLHLPASPDGFNLTRDLTMGLEWVDLTVTEGRTMEDLLVRVPGPGFGALLLAGVTGLLCLTRRARRDPRSGRQRRSSVCAVGILTATLGIASPAQALDFGSPLVYVEDFSAETTYPTTPEIDVMSGGGLVPLGFAPSPPILTGTSARLVATPTGFRHGLYAEIDDAQYSTVESNFGLRTVYSGFTSVDPDEAWLGSVLRFTRDDDLEFAGSWVGTVLRISQFTPSFGSVQIWLSEERYGPNGSPDYGLTEQVQVPFPDGDLLLAGASFTVDLKIDRALEVAVVSIAIEGGSAPTTATIPLIYAQDYSVSSAQQFFQHREGSQPHELDLDSFQLYAEPHVFEPLFNIDVGSFWGTPTDSYAAAGSPGYWNPVVLGPNVLRDVDGVTTGTTASLNAASLEHAAISGSETRDLLADWARSSTGWSVDFADLDHRGAYRVKVYTMADGLAESGALVANGEPHDTLLGVATPSLSEGDSYAVIDTLAPDGRLNVAGSSTFAGLPPNTHLAGLQIETTVPLPEPGFASGLGIAIAMLAGGRRGSRRHPG